MDRPIWRPDEDDEFYYTELWEFMEPVMAFLESDFRNDPDVYETDKFIEFMLAVGESLKMDLRKLESILRTELAGFMMCVAAYSQREIDFFTLESICNTARTNFLSEDQVRAIVDNRHLVRSLLSSPPTVVSLLGAFKGKYKNAFLKEAISNGTVDDVDIREECHKMCACLALSVVTSYASIASSADSYIDLDYPTDPNIAIAVDHFADFNVYIEGNDFAQAYLKYLTEQMKMALQ